MDIIPFLLISVYVTANKNKAINSYRKHHLASVFAALEDRMGLRRF